MKSLLAYHGIKKGQSDVDFVVPFLDKDRRYFVDPSLLRFSSTPLLKRWNLEIEEFLKLVRQLLKRGDYAKLIPLLSIGEAGDVGLGYCVDGRKGSGVGDEISKNILKIVRTNPVFKTRGLLRLEELQWLDVEIGPDRVSDLAVNILKRDIIKYTQQQCRKHGIPMEKVRVQKVFMPDELNWGSMITMLPVNPTVKVKDAFNPQPPVLLVPREIVKPLPLFLNYSDFYGFIEKTGKKSPKEKSTKVAVTKAVLEDPALSERYILSRERQTNKLYRPNFGEEGLTEFETLRSIPTGAKHAHEYRALVAKLLIRIFPDDLAMFGEEKRTHLGDKQRDIVLKNKAKDMGSVFTDFRIKHAASHITVDAKNTESVTPKDVARVASYLNDSLGRVGFIVSRKKASNSLLKQARAFLSDDKKVILFISDEDMGRWIKGGHKIQHTTGEAVSLHDPVKSIENKYSELVSS